MEIVRDAAVIAAYVRKRRQLEEESTMANTLAPTGDAERDAWAKKRCVTPCRSLVLSCQSSADGMALAGRGKTQSLLLPSWRFDKLGNLILPSLCTAPRHIH